MFVPSLTCAGRSALLIAEQLEGRPPGSPRQRMLLRQVLERFETWVRCHPDEEPAWHELCAMPHRKLLILEGLISRLMDEDAKARRLVMLLSPPEALPPPLEIRHLEFVIAFEADGDRLSARLVESPCGKPDRDDVDLCFLGEDLGTVPPSLDAIWLRTRQVRRRNQSETPRWSATSLGTKLFEALFARGGGLRDGWIESQGMLCGRPDLGVRLRLVFDVDSRPQRQVAALPWECLRDPGTGAALCQDLRTPVLRTLQTHRSTVPPPRRRGSRFLLVTSEPVGVPRLEVRSEAIAVQEIWQGIPGKKAVVTSADLSGLRQELLTGRYTGVYFMGHGAFDARSQEGLLVFEDSAGRPLEITSSRLVEQLSGIPLDLVVLGACQSGKLSRSEGAEAFSGVAPALIRGGIPAVVAMQYPISDSAVMAFSQELFRSLSARHSLEAAVTEGRLAIRRQAPDSSEWATPVLYM